MRMKRVLVTGASGFIGRWSVPALLRRGYEVHAVIGPGRRVREIAELAGARVVNADLCAPATAAALLDAVRPSHLLHFAWIATPGAYWTAPENFEWAEASLRLLRAFRDVGGERVVMAGSCAEYDWGRAGICIEGETPLAGGNGAPTLPYACCKVALQMMLATFARQSGLSHGWGRIFFPFGPYEHPDRLVASVVRALLAGRLAECSEGTQVRDFLFSADVADAFAALLDSAVQGPVNIGSGERWTIADLVRGIADLLGRADLLCLGARPAAAREPPVLVPDLRRLRNEVSWAPARTLHGSLVETIAWHRAERRATADAMALNRGNT